MANLVPDTDSIILVPPGDPGAWAVVYLTYSGDKIDGFFFRSVLYLIADKLSRRLVGAMTATGLEFGVALSGPMADVTFNNIVFPDVDHFLAWAKDHAH